MSKIFFCLLASISTYPVFASDINFQFSNTFDCQKTAETYAPITNIFRSYARLHTARDISIRPFCTIVKEPVPYERGSLLVLLGPKERGLAKISLMLANTEQPLSTPERIAYCSAQPVHEKRYVYIPLGENHAATYDLLIPTFNEIGMYMQYPSTTLNQAYTQILWLDACFLQ